MFITKNKKTFRVQMSARDEKEYANRMSKGMYAADKAALKEQIRIASLATCPDCHIKCTVSGFCVQCNRDCRDQLSNQKSTVVKIVKYKY